MKTILIPTDFSENATHAAEYGYQNGVILRSSGHLRVTVNTNQATVEYIHPDRSVAHSYTISAGNKL